MSASCRVCWALLVLLILLVLLVACTPAGMVVQEAQSMQSVCSQLEENAYYSCSQHENWRVLKNGFPLLKNSACDPVPGESLTYRAALTSSEATVPQRTVALVASQEVWNSILIAENIASVLADEIAAGRVVVS